MQPARSKDVAADLRAAHAAIADHDAGSALALMLGVWRAVPDVTLGDAIGLVGARAARTMHAPVGVSVEDRDEKWHAAAREGDPVVRDRLIATITDIKEVDAQIARCEALVGFRDPRVARKLVAMIEEQRWPNLRVATFWLPIFALLVACGDPSVRAAFAKISWYSRLGRISNAQAAAFEARLAKVNARLATAYPDPPPALPAEALAVVAAIVALAGAPIADALAAAATERALLAAVYASPADEGPRAIYADHLQELGDPRGEFIALQLAADWSSPAWRAGTAARRIDHLLEQHRKRWLGPLDACLASSKFTRGFLASGELVRGSAYAAAVDAPADPMWSTVTAITGGIPATDAWPMPGLTGAYELDSAAIVTLAKLASPPPLTHLGWRSVTDDWTPENGYAEKTRTAIAAFARALPRLPKLRFLTLEGRGWDRMRAPQLEWPWRGTSIRTLRLTARLDALESWLAAVAGSTLEELELFGDASAWRITLTRDADRALGRLAIKGGFARNRFGPDLELIAGTLERIPSGRLTELSLDTPQEAWTMDNRRRLARALDVHPRLVAKITNYERPRR